MTGIDGAGTKEPLSIRARDDKAGGNVAAITAMVVDSLEKSRLKTGGMCRRLGYHVRRFGSAADAMFEFHRSPSDYFLTTHDLPEINGYQLGRWIKLQRPPTRVVIITGLCREALAQKMNDSDIDAWLFTPFRMVELQAALTGDVPPQGRGDLLSKPPDPGGDDPVRLPSP
jgi:CheY-like chemotaxis protein